MNYQFLSVLARIRCNDILREAAVRRSLAGAKRPARRAPFARVVRTAERLAARVIEGIAFGSG